MRWALLVVIVAGSIAMAMVLATPERDPDAMEFHAPETEQERVVTLAGLAYLRTLLEGRWRVIDHRGFGFA